MSCEKEAINEVKNCIYIHHFISPHLTFIEDPFISYKHDLQIKNAGKFDQTYYQLAN